MTMDPSSRWVRKTYLGRQSRIIRTVRSLRKVDQRAPVVGHGVRSPCSDSDESDDDVLSVGPMRFFVFLLPRWMGQDDTMTT